MVRKAAARALFLLSASLVAAGASAQQQQTPPPGNAPPMQSPYLTPIGPSVTLDVAKKAVAAAAAEAKKNGWLMAFAVVDPAGTLVYYEKTDNTQLGSANVAVDKARSAALYKRPTKALQDALAGGGAGLRILALQGAVPVEGGLPLVHDGKLIGAIGASGDTSEHDGQCAQAGVQTLTAGTAAAHPERQRAASGASSTTEYPTAAPRPGLAYEWRWSPRNETTSPGPRTHSSPATYSAIWPESQVRYSRVPGVWGIPVRRASAESSIREISVPGIGSGRRCRSVTWPRVRTGRDPRG